jgi:hypothetical protein
VTIFRDHQKRESDSSILTASPNCTVSTGSFRIVENLRLLRRPVLGGAPFGHVAIIETGR